MVAARLDHHDVGDIDLEEVQGAVVGWAVAVRGAERAEEGSLGLVVGHLDGPARHPHVTLLQLLVDRGVVQGHPRVTSEVARLHRVVHHPEAELALEEEGLDAADARRAVGAEGGQHSETRGLESASGQGRQFGCGLDELHPCRHPLIIPGSCDTPGIDDRLTIRAYDEVSDRAWLEARLDDGFGAGHLQARRSELIDVLIGEGTIAERDGQPIGVALWRRGDTSTELTYLWAFEAGAGVGTKLVEELFERVATPIWVVTTNDNVDALRFYQRLGFRLRELRPGAVDEARRELKATIPVERDGMAIRDEIELVLDRTSRPDSRDA